MAATKGSLARVLLVTGKGGVGKTTVAAGLAVAEVEANGSAALVEFGDGESGQRALGDARNMRGLTHVVIHPAEAIERAATPLLGGAMMAKLTLGNFAVKRMLRAAPAIRELAMLECVRMVSAEKPNRRVIVDLPATGHGLAWLAVPSQLRAATSSGPLHDLCVRLERDLVRAGMCSPVVVTLPERLVLLETLELCGAMKRQLGIPVARLLANRVPAPVDEGALAEAEALAASSDPHAVHARELARLLSTRMAAREHAMQALAEAGRASDDEPLIPLVLPEAPVDPSVRLVAQWLKIAGAL